MTIEALCITEIGELLGVTRQRASQLAARKDFPTPIVRTRSFQAWLASDVEEYRQNREAIRRRHWGHGNYAEERNG